MDCKRPFYFKEVAAQRAETPPAFAGHQDKKKGEGGIKCRVPPGLFKGSDNAAGGGPNVNKKDVLISMMGFSQKLSSQLAFVLGLALRVRKEKNSDVAPDGQPVLEEPTKAGADNLANALCILIWICAGKCNFFLRRPKREGRERRGRSNLQTMHLVRAPMEGLHLFLVLFCVCARKKTVTWLQMTTWCRKSPPRRAQIMWQTHYVY